MSEQSSSSHGPVVETHDAAMAHGHDAHDSAGHESHGGIAKYIYVFIALCFLTSLSFLTYSDWWRANFTSAESRLLMMAVSTCKALLVILCFMHIWWEANWKFVLTIPAALMSLFLILMLVPDVGNRGRYASEERRHQMADERKPDAKPGHDAKLKSADSPAAEHAP